MTTSSSISASGCTKLDILGILGVVHSTTRTNQPSQLPNLLDTHMSTGPSNVSSPRIEELDVLRGLAITLVIAYHLPGHPVRGGLIGVDLFMVLSGYLVTSRLVTGPVDSSVLADFYRRRVRRIIPAVAAVVGMCAVLAAIGSSLFRGSRLWDLAASMVFVANWRFVLSGANYFNTVSGTSPVQHLWSLAIEEQFYLVWPLVMMTVPRRFHRPAVAVIVLGSMVWMGIHANSWSSSRLYFGTDTRVFALATGAFLAVVRHNRPPSPAKRPRFIWPALLAGYSSAAVLIIPEHHLMYRFGYQLLAVFAGVMLWESITRSQEPGRRRPVWTRPLVIAGVRSYSLYLVHWPVFTELTKTRTHLDGVLLMIVQLVTTLVLSEFLYRVVEKRIVDSRRALDYSLRFVLPGGFVLASIVAAAALMSPPIPTYLRGGVHSSTDKEFAGSTPRVLVVGDSVVASLEPALRPAAQTAHLTLDVTSISGCGLMPGVTVGEDGAVYEPSRQCEGLVSENLWEKMPAGGYDAVLWLDAWDAEDRLIGGKVLRQASDGTELATHVEEVVNRLAEIAPIVFIAPVAPRASQSTANPEGPSVYAANRVIEAAATINRVSADSDGRIKVINLPDLVCRSLVPCADSSSDGTRFRPIDGIHFDGRGATLAAEYIVKQLTSDLLG